jgi:hypothetical protein
LSDPWFQRVEREHRAGHLSHAAFLVLRKLSGYFGGRDEAWPSHATLAQAAGVSVRSVQRALEAGRGLGLIEWTARRFRAGWRSLQSSNLYRRLMPTGAVSTHSTSPRTGGQAGRGTTKKEKQERIESNAAALARLMAEAALLPDLLRARREALTARWQGQSRVT